MIPWWLKEHIKQRCQDARTSMMKGDKDRALILLLQSMEDLATYLGPEQ